MQIEKKVVPLYQKRNQIKFNIQRIKIMKTKETKKNDCKGIIFISSFHRGSETIYAGTIEYLIERTFGYTLECGHSWNEKINPRPKTKKSLVKALNASAEECRRYSDFYELSTKDAFVAAGGVLDDDRHGCVSVKK